MAGPDGASRVPDGLTPVPVQSGGPSGRAALGLVALVGIALVGSALVGQTGGGGPGSEAALGLPTGSAPPDQVSGSPAPSPTAPLPPPGTPPPRVAVSIGPVATCPPGSNPDEPGPVDQARPFSYYWSPKAFDRRAGKLIVLVGADGLPGTAVETWTFDVCSNTWARMHPDREPPLQVQSLVYDVDSDLTIGVHTKDWYEPPVIGNVWAYDLEANTWTELGKAPTRALRFHDPVSGLVFADGCSYDVETDTWIPNPSAVDCYDCVYDFSVDRAIVYGSPLEDGVLEAWLLDLRAGTWSRSGAETPDCTMHAWAPPAIVYDEAAERTVVTGYPNMCAYDASEDRWEILNERDPSRAVPKPTVYDPVNRRLLVFESWLGDVAAFDLVTREWTVLLEREEQ